MISEQDLCSLHQVSVQDLQKRSPGKISVQDLYKSSVGKISVQDLYKRSLGKISARRLLARSLQQISVQDLHKRSPGKISVKDLYKSSVGKISVRGLLARSLNKISRRGLLARSLYKLPIRGLLARCLCEISRFVRAWCEPGASLRNRNAHGHATRAMLYWNLGKMPHPRTATPVLCEPAQSKCTWTFHKSHFVWKFTGKMPDANDTTSIEHRALTPTVRTPQCGHTVWGTLVQHVVLIVPVLNIQKSNFPSNFQISISHFKPIIIQCWRNALGKQT